VRRPTPSRAALSVDVDVHPCGRIPYHTNGLNRI
jgi:hypothetical protein